MRRILLDNIHAASTLGQVGRSCKAGRRQGPVVATPLHAAGRAAAVFRVELHHCLRYHRMPRARQRATGDVETVLLADCNVAASPHRHGNSLVPILLIEVMLICIKHF